MIPSIAPKHKSSTLFVYPSEPLELDFGDLLRPMTDDEFADFCQRHRDLRIEMDQFGEITIMSPTYSETGAINFELSVDFGVWARADGTGKGFDSSTGFILPNGAKRSPDLSWIKLDRWLAIPAEQRKKFAPILSSKSALHPIHSPNYKPKWQNISTMALRWVGCWM